MAKVQSIEDLEGQRAQLQDKKVETEGRIGIMREALERAKGKDAELFEGGLFGKDVARERTRGHEQMAVKVLELDRTVGELEIVVQAQERIRGEIVAARSRALDGRIAALAQKRAEGVVAAAREIPGALAGVTAGVEEMILDHAEERELRNQRSHQVHQKSDYECPGEQYLIELRVLVGKFLASVRAIEEGRRP
jgi:hypothetical protein